MKRNIFIALAALFGAILGYLAMCFFAWDWNPGTWGRTNHQGTDVLVRYVGLWLVASLGFASARGAWVMTKGTKS
jgi:hypothetical protein